MKKLAVFFPGIGYTVDKPLIYYSRKLAADNGYDIKLLPYEGFPQKVRGDKDKMKESFEMAWSQTLNMLQDDDLKDYDEILFVGKSVGTVVAGRFASESRYRDKISLILYTPLKYTFEYGISNAIAFTGSADPWVENESEIPKLCEKCDILLYIYKDANHSLETGMIDIDLDNMKDIMKKTEKYIKKKGKHYGN